MSVKTPSQRDLIEEVIDPAANRDDREMAARAILHKYPAVTRTFPEFARLLLPEGGLTCELFDIASDAFQHVHPSKSLDGRPNPGLDVPLPKEKL